MTDHAQQAHPEVVDVTTDQFDLFSVARKVLPWVVLAFVVFRVGAVFLEFRVGQEEANRRAILEAAAVTVSASGAKTASATAAATKTTTAATNAPKAVVLTDGVNFHSTASNDGKVISSLKRGTELTVVGREGNWLKLKDARGNVGYVYGNKKFIAERK